MCVLKAFVDPTACPFRVNDDTEFEGEERFKVYLKTSDNRIIIPANMSSTIVHINDPEDGTLLV